MREKFGGVPKRKLAQMLAESQFDFERLRDETGLPVLVAENPLTSVVLGAGKMLSDFNLLRRISLD